MVLPGVSVVAFGIETRISQRRGPLDPPQRLVEQGHKAVGGHCRLAPRERGDPQVRAALEGRLRLSVAGIADCEGRGRGKDSRFLQSMSGTFSATPGWMDLTRSLLSLPQRFEFLVQRIAVDAEPLGGFDEDVVAGLEGLFE